MSSEELLCAFPTHAVSLERLDGEPLGPEAPPCLLRIPETDYVHALNCNYAEVKKETVESMTFRLIDLGSGGAPIF